MAGQDRREREKQETRRKILDAARELFAREGYEAVTMRRIAEIVDYSPTAIYVHFADKADLIRQLCAEDFRALAAHFTAIAAVPDPIERLLQAGRAYVEFGLRFPNHYRVMFMTPGVKAELTPGTVGVERGNPEQDAYAFLRAIVVDALEAGRFRPELADAEAICQACWATMHGVVSLWITMEPLAWVELRPALEIAALAGDALVAGLLRPGAPGGKKPARKEKR